MHSALVHCCVWFEVLFNVSFVFLKHQIDLLIIIRVENLIEIAANTILLVMEPINIGSSDCVDMLCKKLSQHTPIVIKLIFYTCIVL